MPIAAAHPNDRSTAPNVEVKVARPNTVVYAQRRYRLAPAERTASASPGRTLEDAVRGLLPDATRALALAVSTFAGPAAKATLVVNVDVGAFGRGGSSVPLEFALSAVDATGREIAFARDAATVMIGPASGDNPPEANVQTRLELPAGEYEVRLAVSDPKTSTVASVFAPVTVPAFDVDPLSLSGVIVEATGPRAAASPSPPGPPAPTTRRMFDRLEQVHAIVQVYQGTRRTDALQRVSARTRIEDAHHRVVRDQRLELTADNFQKRTASVSLDMSGLPPGGYVLAIEASMDRRQSQRSLPFAVR